MRLGKLEKLAEFTNTDRSVKTSFVKGHLNKLLFIVDGESIANTYEVDKVGVSVKYVADKVTNIATAINAKYFKDITNMKYGAVENISEAFKTFLQALAENSTDSETATDAQNLLLENKNHESFIVDIGSLMVDNGNEIHVNLKKEANQKIYVYAITDEEEEDFHLYTYDIEEDKNELHQNTMSIYVIMKNTGYSVPAPDNFDIQVDSDTAQYTTDYIGLMMANALMGKTENTLLTKTVKIVDNIIPEDVKIKLIGGGSDDVSILVQRVISDFEKVSIQKSELLEKKAIVMEKFERKSPETAKVLQASGTPSSVELRNFAYEFKTPIK